MKKIKLVLLAVILLTTVLFLASCGVDSFVDLVDREYAPVDTYPAYTQSAAVSALTDMSVGSGAGDLKTFTKYDATTFLTKYVVYDVANDKIVWQEEESKTESATSITSTTYSVSLRTIKQVSYFTVTTTKTVVTLEDSLPIKTDVTKSVAIWAYNGSAYAELVKVTDPRTEIVTAQDLIYFEGKVYRADKETKVIAYAFDYPVLATFPLVFVCTDNYYVGGSDTLLITYDKELNQLASYQLPSYADVEGMVVLGDKMLVQYWVAEDLYGDSYTVIDEDGDKYTIYTVLLDLETGKTKEIDTEYVLADEALVSSDDAWTEDYGFAAIEDEVIAIAGVYKIENKRINEFETAIEWAAINEKGKITVLEAPTAMPVAEIHFVAKDLWMLRTVDSRYYMVNGDGEILAELDYAKVEEGTVNYLAANGKLYDYALNEVYDYRADKLTIVDTTPKAFLFTNEDEELIIYANGQKTTLINKAAAEEGKRVYSDMYSNIGAGYFVIVDTNDEQNTKYEIYNVEGKLIKTVDQTVSFYISSVASAKDGAVRLVKITTRAQGADDSIQTYYRFS